MIIGLIFANESCYGDEIDNLMFFESLYGLEDFEIKLELYNYEYDRGETDVDFITWLEEHYPEIKPIEIDIIRG